MTPHLLKNLGLDLRHQHRVFSTIVVGDPILAAVELSYRKAPGSLFYVGKPAPLTAYNYDIRYKDKIGEIHFNESVLDGAVPVYHGTDDLFASMYGRQGGPR